MSPNTFPSNNPSPLTGDEFQVILDELSDEQPEAPDLPKDFSREDIYFDHD